MLPGLNPILALCVLSRDPFTIGGMCYTRVPVATVSEISSWSPEHATTPADISVTTPGILSCFSLDSHSRTAELNEDCNLTQITARAFAAWPDTKVWKYYHIGFVKWNDVIALI